MLMKSRKIVKSLSSSVVGLLRIDFIGLIL